MPILPKQPRATDEHALRHPGADEYTTRALGWGITVGAVQAAIAFAFWWLELATFHALAVVLIAAVYVGFAVSDGRTNVIAVESTIVVAFFVVARVWLRPPAPIRTALGGCR
jgi:hypothetical protein